MPERHYIVITGLEDLSRKLDLINAELQGKALRKAVRRAAMLFRNAARGLVHRSAGTAHHASSGSERPHLADDIKVRIKRGKPGTVTANIGPSGKTSYIANFLEFGTAPHTIKAKRGKQLYVPGIGFTKRVDHPGSPPHPFMRPAFDTQVNAAIEAFKTSLLKSIEKFSVR